MGLSGLLLIVACFLGCSAVADAEKASGPVTTALIPDGRSHTIKCPKVPVPVSGGCPGAKQKASASKTEMVQQEIQLLSASYWLPETAPTYCLYAYALTQLQKTCKDGAAQCTFTAQDPSPDQGCTGKALLVRYACVTPAPEPTGAINCQILVNNMIDD
ncbi:uncharacterized protein LOC129600280 [Paramacrobiotus metropolitanus]|uniref:uncharacterized protein LOC129600280 n=1 Tax=Paramacrobiotus metropolitanus TaxID=2943436 RepID=UPI002445ED3E|nr:uncharacterized protein LOC129600280 [Paramacrobiotus metropolitanus]